MTSTDDSTRTDAVRHLKQLIVYRPASHIPSPAKEALRYAIAAIEREKELLRELRLARDYISEAGYASTPTDTRADRVKACDAVLARASTVLRTHGDDNG